MRGARPDTTGLEAIHNQPEFNQQPTIAARNFQRKIRMAPADSYPDVGLLAHLRQGS
jgi:hypothetical protein